MKKFLKQRKLFLTIALTLIFSVFASMPGIFDAFVSRAYAADTTAPTVSITPIYGNVNGTRTINVTTSDDTGVTGVDYFLDGQLKGSSTTAPFSYNWDTTTDSEGSHTITAKAHDAAGNVGTSSIGATVGATLTFTNPVNGATVGGLVSIKATVSANAPISSAKIYINSMPLGTVSPDASGNISFMWDTTNYSNNTLYWINVDTTTASQGIKTTSRTSVMVNNTIATEPPSISVSTPYTGAQSGTVPIYTGVISTVSVNKVEYYVDNNLVGAIVGGPYTFNWDTTTASEGQHTITAKGYDGAGNVGVSNTLNVTVGTTAILLNYSSNDTIGGKTKLQVSLSSNAPAGKVWIKADGMDLTPVNTNGANVVDIDWDPSATGNLSVKRIEIKASTASQNIVTTTGDIPLMIDDGLGNQQFYIFDNHKLDNSNLNINLRNGNVFLQNQDLNLPSKGLSNQITRSYNSRSYKSGLFGYGWSSDLDVALDTTRAGWFVYYTRSDGEYLQFTNGPDYLSPDEQYLKLHQDTANNVFTMTDKGGIKLTFDGNGKLKSKENRNGNKIIYNREGV